MDNIEKIRKIRQKSADVRAQKIFVKAQRLETKSKKIRENIPTDMQFWTQPGIEHLKTRHRARLQQSTEMLIEAEGLRAKAYSIQNNVCVAGDAERMREIKRIKNDSQIIIGTKIFDPIFQKGTILKINKKTYTIDYGGGYVRTRDKSFVQKII